MTRRHANRVRTLAIEVDTAFERTVEEGETRLSRSWPQLLATGLVGGIDVGVGVIALVVVHHYAHNALLDGLAFSLGFIAVTLANSELFTENFLVPLAAVAAEKSPPLAVARLWFGTLASNLVSGWIVMALFITAQPRYGNAAVELGRTYTDAGLGWRSFSGALLGGAFITLMTWMERSTESVPAKLISAITIGFLVAVVPLNHAVVSSMEMFVALQHGAPFGYLDWFALLAWYAVANIIGGIGLVAGLRLVQVGSDKVEEERQDAGTTE